MINNHKTSPFQKEVWANEAEPGMYVTKNSIYMIYKTGNGYQIYRNGELIQRDEYTVVIKSNDEVSQLYWNNYNSYTSNIQRFYKQISKSTLIDGFDKIADTLIKRGSNLSKYINDVNRFIRDSKYNLPGFEEKISINGSKYNIYNQGQYGMMALYIKAFNNIFPGMDLDKFINDKRIRGIFHDMAIDSNGLASAVEKKANEGIHKYS